MTDQTDAVAQLRRWEQSGAHWRVVARPPGGVTVALLTCDAGEEVDRLHSTEPALLTYIGDRDTDESP